ncbi:PP2C family protein-serine/threonine phosphatase [Streptomyces sp. NPDC087294]|uniref:PP2C family protein-serine/threonine phosphatase n=1 Tax=Streptomyces sp. NPDC087294 TaxID=3365777 RepID=UPI0037F92D0C
MPPHLSADRPAPQPEPGSVDALITQTRRLKGDVDAVRRGAPADGSDPEERWQRALCDLALHQLDDLDAHLAQLREGPPLAPSIPPPGPRAVPPLPGPDSLLSRVGSAEWNLLTDEASWSAELYQILGRDPAAAPLTLDELPSLVHEDDRAALSSMVTGCLIDARPIDGEFRVVRPDSTVRTVHMMGEPVLAGDGSTTSMWAVVRDVSELRRTQRTLTESRASLRPPRSAAARPAEPRDPAPWQGALTRSPQGPGPLDIAVYAPTSPHSPIGASWYDALELPCGQTVWGVGDITGHADALDSGPAILLGALRGMALAGTEPGQLLTLLNQLLDTSGPAALAGALCCRYRAQTRTLLWARAGRPAPLLFRGGTGRSLHAPDGPLLGTATGTAYRQLEQPLERGDVLLLPTEGLVSGHTGTDTSRRLLDLAPLFDAADTAQDCVRLLTEEFGDSRGADPACALVARVTARP